MKNLGLYLKPYWKSVLLAPLLMLVEVATSLLQPKLMANIVDKGVATGNTDYIIQQGLIMIGASFIGVLGGFGTMFFSSIAAQSFGTDLRTAVFSKTQSFSFSLLDKFKTASLITRLTSDILQVQTFVLVLLRMFVRSPLLFLGSLIMSLSINPGLALILVVTIPFLALSLTYVIQRGFPLFSKVQKGLDRVNTVLRENLAGIRVVKAFVRTDYELNRFNIVNNEYMQLNIQASTIIATIMPIMLFILNCSILAVIWFGGIRVNNGNMQVGQIMAFINYMTQILFSLMMVGFMLMMVSRTKVSAERIQEVLETESDIKDKVHALITPIKTGRIHFENVSFRYKDASGKSVLQDISFSARPGETVAILGATGSGKSTLVNLIPRFYDVTEGHILIDGIDVRDLNKNTLRESIGMVLQESILFSGTVKENILWGNENASDEEIIEATKPAQAHEFIMKLPQGYDTVIGQKGVNLSGGQKQRIAIARALVKKPKILILDDSTSAVDVSTETHILAALKKLMTNSTFIVITQRISTVHKADKILLLEDGQITACGNHLELLHTSNTYQNIYYPQVGATEVVKHE